MAAGIASGFVRKLYRILDQESESIVGWDASGLSFSIHDSQQLNDVVLPRYFRGRMSAFRQQLLDHGFEQIECEDDEARECYAHPHFQRGCPDRLSYIVRNPKPKQKTGQNAAAQVQHDLQYRQPNQLHHQNINRQQPSLGIHIGPSVKGPGRTPLTVTLTAGKRASPVNNAHQVVVAPKRLRAASDSKALSNLGVGSASHPPQGQVPAPPPPANLNHNPLFSNDSSTDLGLDVARVFSLSRISDSGLLPNSTDLPEPITYLTRLLQGNSATSDAVSGAVPSSTSSMTSSTSQSGQPQVFSEDLMKSALYFLVSSSATGVNADHGAGGNGLSAQVPEGWTARMERLSTSGFLSSMLVSSATGREAANGVSSSVWEVNGANPLFSRSTEQDEEEDSIWNLLLASSIDRVKTAIQDVTSPQERLRLILEERERLEEQRKRIDGLGGEEKTASQIDSSGPYKPSLTQITKPLKSALKKSGTNPLFTESGKSGTKNLLFTHPPSPKAAKQTATASASNPLFANGDYANIDSDSMMTHNPLFARKDGGDTAAILPGSEVKKVQVEASMTGKSVVSIPSALSTNSSSAEDGLWRLLMTSSVDWLRKGAAEFEV